MKGESHLSPGLIVFTDGKAEFEVAFEQSALKSALSLCASSPRAETGGILVGRYVDGGRRAAVFEATGPPPGSSAGRDWFKRGNRGLAQLLVTRWNSEPRTYYLGEWHYHTDRIPWPSPQDLHQMREVAGDPRYQCTNPILLVVSPVEEGRWCPQLFVFGTGMSPVALLMVDDPQGNGS